MFSHRALPSLLLATVALCLAYMLHITNLAPVQAGRGQPLAIEVHKAQYLGAVLDAKRVSPSEFCVTCVYGDFHCPNQDDLSPSWDRFSTGVRVVLLQSAKGLHLSTDLERWSMRYNAQDLLRIQQDLKHDLQVHADLKAEARDASKDPG